MATLFSKLNAVALLAAVCANVAAAIKATNRMATDFSCVKFVFHFNKTKVT